MLLFALIQKGSGEDVLGFEFEMPFTYYISKHFFPFLISVIIIFFTQKHKFKNKTKFSFKHPLFWLALLSTIIGIMRFIVDQKNSEWYSNPANKAKIERNLKENSTELESNNYKQVRDIKIETYDWRIIQYNNGKINNFPNLHIKNGADEILIMSYAKKRFNDLSEFSNYQKTDFEKSYSKTSPRFIERMYFEYIGQEAFMDVFSLTINNQKINLGLLNFTYKGNYYHISHYFTTKSRKIIDNINLNSETESKSNGYQETKEFETKPNDASKPQKPVVNKKSIKMLSVPIEHNWYIKQAIHETSIDFFGVILTNDIENGFISVYSQKPHEYINGLNNLAEYQNEKIVRNLKPTGIILKSEKRINKEFQGVEALFEYFDGTYESTNEKLKLIAINMIYKGYHYTISYVVNKETEKIIESIELK